MDNPTAFLAAAQPRVGTGLLVAEIRQLGGALASDRRRSDNGPGDRRTPVDVGP